jgi:hypothetical protein
MSNEMHEEVQRVLDAITLLGSQPEDPAERFKRLSVLLKDWPDLHKAVRSLRQDVANELYDGGMTYDAMGKLIGVTESRARHIAKGITHPSKQKKERADAGHDSGTDASSAVQ